MKNVFRFAFVIVALLGVIYRSHADVISDHQGRWLGQMTIPHGGPTIKFGADLFLRADGTSWASGASPDQDAFDLPVKRIGPADDGIELEFSFGILKMHWAVDHFQGEYRQHGTPEWLPLAMRQVAQFPARQRPQTPKAPFPYSDQTLSLAGADGVVLSATLSLPHGKPNPTLVVLVNGSGPAARDEDVFGHRTFAVLADHLARQGIAVLRYDKRGIGRSTGDYESHTESQLIDDLDALVQTIRARKQFSRLGLIGHSQGAILAAAVAARSPNSVDFLVSLAGVGLSGLQNTVLQDIEYARDQQATPTEVARLAVYVRAYYDEIIANAEDGPRMAALKALQDRLTADDRALIERRHMNVGTLSQDWATKPFLRASLMANPTADWLRVRCPVLALNGSLDHQVPGAENLAGIVAALSVGGNTNGASRLLPSLNHMFQTAQTGSDDEYAAIEETIAPVALAQVAQFVLEQAR